MRQQQNVKALPTAKAAKILGVSISTLRKLALDKKIKYHTINERGDRRYPLSAIDDFMNHGGWEAVKTSKKYVGM